MNVKRIVTTVIGLPIVITVLVLANKYIVDVLIGIIATIAMYEYLKCIKPKARIIPIIGYLFAISLMFTHLVFYDVFFVVALGIPILFLILFFIVILSNMKINFQDVAYTVFGVVYICYFLLFLSLVYGIEEGISGKILIWYIIISSWGTDTFAYIIGKKFGKHKFSKISPNKTIEGCISGILGAIVISLIFTFFMNENFGSDISYITITIITLVLSIIGQIGDFSASTIKRYFEIKDFSNLFPGHGGILDRIDSVMFIAPFAYVLLRLIL